MGLLETIVVGSYLYTTATFLWLQDRYERLRKNHFQHYKEALNETRKHVGLPPMKDE